MVDFKKLLEKDKMTEKEIKGNEFAFGKSRGIEVIHPSKKVNYLSVHVNGFITIRVDKPEDYEKWVKTLSENTYIDSTAELDELLMNECVWLAENIMKKLEVKIMMGKTDVTEDFKQPPPNNNTSDNPPITQQSALPTSDGQVAYEAIGAYLESLDFRKSDKKIHKIAYFRTIKSEAGGKAGFFNVFWDENKGWGSDMWFYEPKPKGTTVKFNAMTADPEWRKIVDTVDKFQAEHTIKSG